MATPTPSTNTPQKHLLALSSPAPRSVPPTTFDSPQIFSMLGEGGIGMGISMSGMGMSNSMSQLGFGSSQLGRGDEDERRRRLQGIIDMLKTRPGRVSEEGIIALCRKEGLGFERMVSSDGTVALMLAVGNEAICDIAIRNGDVESVKLELAADEDGEFTDSGSAMLFSSLTPSRPGQNKINLMLDRFAANLDKLLTVDKLSTENGGVQCYKAIFAVHASLRRLFEHEKKMAMALVHADAPNASAKAEREVLCKKSGRPRMNAGSCLGLSLEYWMDRRHLISKKNPQRPSSPKGKEKMNTEDAYPEDTNPDINRIYSLTIECEASQSSMYTPIRIPTSWISENIEVPKAPDGPDAAINEILKNAPTIDWLDPKPTYLNSPSGATGDHDAMNIDNAPGRLPNIRFVARFNPPLVVPLPVYANIMASVNLECPQDLHPTTFVGLAIRPESPDPGSNTMAGGYTIEIQSKRDVLSIDKDGNETIKQHSNSLYVPKLEFSRTLESLPFQHPRQLVELLPTLRQYAFTTSLLQKTFVDKPPPPPSHPRQTFPLSPPLTPKKAETEQEALQLDISLSYSPPAPRLTVTIPHPSSQASPQTASAPPSDPTDLLAYLLSPHASASATAQPPLKMVVDVLANGELFMQEQNVVAAEAGAAGMDTEAEMQKRDVRVSRVARGLDVCGDLGVWGEWVRRGVLKGM